MHSILDQLRARFENFADRFRRYRRPFERAQSAIEEGRWRTACLELESAHESLLRSHPNRRDLLAAVEDARFRTALFSEDDQLISAMEALNSGRPGGYRPRYVEESQAARELGDELLQHQKLHGAARFGDVLLELQPETAARNYLIARLWLPSRSRASDVEDLLNRIDRLGTSEQSALARVTRARFLACPQGDEAQWKRARAVLEPLEPWTLQPEARLAYARVMLTSWRSIRRVRALDALSHDFKDDGQRKVAGRLLADFLQNPPSSLGTLELDRVEGAIERLHREEEPELRQAMNALSQWRKAREKEEKAVSELDGDNSWKRAAKEFLAGRPFNESRPESGPERWAMEAMTLARSFDGDRCEALAKEMVSSGRLGPGARGSAALGILAPLVPEMLEQFGSLPPEGQARALVGRYVERAGRPGYGFRALGRLAAEHGAWAIAAQCVVRAARDAVRGGEPMRSADASWCAATITRATAEHVQGGEYQAARQLLERWQGLSDLL